MQPFWFIVIPALALLLLSVGAMLVPSAPGRRKWPFVLMVFVNAITLFVVVFTKSEVPVTHPAKSDQTASQGAQDTRNEFWVAIDEVDKHSCPSLDCGVVGRLSFRDPVTLLERKGGWARISEPRKALCVNGHTRYVVSGDDRCVASNGINGGTYYDWIKEEGLSEQLPSSGSPGIDHFEAIVAGSDDFRRNRDVFAAAAQRLIEASTCTKDELKNQGGFSRVDGAGGQNVYFVYCGGDTMSDRVFIDTKTQQVFR